jgi:hypothetical protein
LEPKKAGAYTPPVPIVTNHPGLILRSSAIAEIETKITVDKERIINIIIFIEFILSVI